MQSVAFTQQGDLIRADEATQKIDYLCPECLSSVRLRRGQERAAHFFHTSDNRSCRLRHNDGMHRAIQSWLVEQLGEKETITECHFPTINRVADIAFFPKRVVFEVQLSPIDESIALKRTQDYWSVGWHVIWLLHASQFGKRTASAFEKILSTIPHYFTDRGYRTGSIWDEHSAVCGRRRRWFSSSPDRQYIDTIMVQVHRTPPDTVSQTSVRNGPELIEMRKKLWSCSLSGDFRNTPLRAPRKEKSAFFQRIALFLRLIWYWLISKL